MSIRKQYTEDMGHARGKKKLEIHARNEIKESITHVGTGPMSGRR